MVEIRGNYSATSKNMKLVHWSLMGGLLHLVQRGGDWVSPQPAQAPTFFLSFFLICGDTCSLRMPALRPASQAGPMRNPKEGTSVVLRDTTRLT